MGDLNVVNHMHFGKTPCPDSITISASEEYGIDNILLNTGDMLLDAFKSMLCLRLEWSPNR